jgi:hypothetical protein
MAEMHAALDVERAWQHLVQEGQARQLLTAWTRKAAGFTQAQSQTAHEESRLTAAVSVFNRQRIRRPSA